MVLPGFPANDLDLSLYGGVDPRNLPRYTYTEASRATDVPASTIQAWVRGMSYTRKRGPSGYVQPVIERPDAEDPRLSFYNLFEVHILRALRRVHEVKLDAVRQAIRLAKQEHGIERLLIDPQLKTTGGALFLDYYLDLVELSLSRQLAMRHILQAHLQRVRVHPKLKLAEFFPEARNPILKDKDPILVSPFISFGNPVIGRIGVSTHAITSRLNLGEAEGEIIEDYDLTKDEFEEAILYESAA
jgi:uncharacterized protein (DUF433 family)